MTINLGLAYQYTYQHDLVPVIMSVNASTENPRLNKQRIIKDVLRKEISNFIA